jgi:hypothetical protein
MRGAAHAKSLQAGVKKIIDLALLENRFRAVFFFAFFPVMRCYRTALSCREKKKGDANADDECAAPWQKRLNTLDSGLFFWGLEIGRSVLRVRESRVCMMTD